MSKAGLSALIERGYIDNAMVRGFDDDALLAFYLYFNGEVGLTPLYKDFNLLFIHGRDGRGKQIQLSVYSF